MQFGLKQLLFAAFSIAFLIGNFVAYGVNITLFLSIIVIGAAYFVIRTATDWKDLRRVERIYGVLAATALIAFFFSLLIAAGMSPSIANQRTARNLKFSLASEQRFDSIFISYYQRKGQFIRIAGSVKTMTDYQELRSHVDKRNFERLDGIRWNVIIAETGQHIEALQRTLAR